MSQKRPFGLTICAWINFFISAYHFIGVVGLPIMLITSGKNIFTQSILMGILETFIPAVLLFLSGIGFLKMKRLLGYLLGNLSAIYYIGYMVFIYFKFNDLLSQELKWGSFIGMIYPITLLFILNLRYKKNLIY